jgi:hypothetical protein
MMVDAGATPGLWDQLALHPRAQEVASAHMYSLYARETDDFPPLFCFGDLVELELECAPREHPARTELKRVPAIVIGVIRDNWLRLLVFNRWLGNQAHSVFHVRSWNVHGNPAWLSVPRTEMRSVIFGAPALYSLGRIHTCGAGDADRSATRRVHAGGAAGAGRG